MTNASDSFFGSGEGLNYPLGSEAQWVGRVRGGRIITEPREQQQIDINTKQPKFWDEGKTRPMMQLVFTVVCDGSGQAAANGWATDERKDAQDNGYRLMYIKGKDLTEAVGSEITRHRVQGLRIGDEIYNVWTGERPGKGGIGKARTWACKLFPGTAVESNQAQFFGNEAQPAPAAAPNGFAQGYQQPGNPTGAAPHPSQFGYGHNPAQSPGGQAHAAAAFQQPAGPPPSFQAPAAAPQQPPAPNGFGTPPSNPAGSGQFRPDDNGWQQPPAQVGAPVPPNDDPWGQRAPQQTTVPSPWGQ